MKILLCSPYYHDKENTTCGIANWTRNIMSRQNQNSQIVVDLLPYDRTVDLDEESTVWERLISGIKDYFGLVLKTKKRLEKNNYDILQVSTSAGLGLIRDYLVVLLGNSRGVKVVFHYHFGRMPELLEGTNWQSRLMRKILKHSFASIVMDRKSYIAMTERGYKTYYLPNPLSDANFKKIKELSKDVERRDNQLLFVGHVVPTKGIFELVESCVNIENINARIIGKVFQDTKDKLVSIAKRRDNGTWLKFVGEVPHDDVLKEMLECDMYVLPTYTEGFPNVILESMACACPIVTCSVGAIPEMLDVLSDPCGIVVPPKDAKAIEKSIRDLLKDPERKHLLGEKARMKIESNYTVDAVWTQLETIWSSL